MKATNNLIALWNALAAKGIVQIHQSFDYLDGSEVEIHESMVAGVDSHNRRVILVKTTADQSWGAPESRVVAIHERYSSNLPPTIDTYLIGEGGVAKTQEKMTLKQSSPWVGEIFPSMIEDGDFERFEKFQSEGLVLKNNGTKFTIAQ